MLLAKRKQGMESMEFLVLSGTVAADTRKDSLSCHKFFFMMFPVFGFFDQFLSARLFMALSYYYYYYCIYICYW